MNVFISSVISGMEEYRNAVARAVRSLGHEVTRAEDFGAKPESPQIACLAAVRNADAVILLTGERYGALQSSGLSATHEEYLEARERCPVLVMVQNGVTREVRETNFLDQVQNWERGHYTKSFTTTDQLFDVTLRAIHEMALANAIGPVNSEEILQRAKEMLTRRPMSHLGGTYIAIALACGPLQSVLRPAQLESKELGDHILKLLLFGDVPVFLTSAGTKVATVEDAIWFTQDGRALCISEAGSVLYIGELQSPEGGLPVIIEEHVRETVLLILRFTNAVLSYIDAPHRLSHVAPLISLTNAQYLGWRTSDEHRLSPNQVEMNVSDRKIEALSLSPAHRSRAAFQMNAEEIAEDLVVRLRRALKK